ncbi:hypothetical protein [Geomonas azotofigens]|uniref:hypothetical protein n=1 Tax=Geomonas azotofigens TaxID=2843196 RepID=UPI001C10C6CA|nr:hypothetical protein [Geomonas azotofigens]MBU5612463.1 hypothetical protein [Geomonas azotofigens]
MKRFMLIIALLLPTAAARAEMTPTGSAATTDQVASPPREERAPVSQGGAARGAFAAKQQGFNQLEGAPLPAEELNAVHGRYLLGGAPLQPSLQLSDVKLWDEGRAVARSQQRH